ncbi:DUF4188 domain-containing protein [Novosphingobium piscinae]|uniref:DUF4188 domain-containing protein n=1 Tax=Novosphingobium piscinae TaxID=1507448 RepID=A0A7X1FX33_9SPHN|nr:DUF4188 domain-containing protein [Novosphingobium piscinae]MBC2668600.1 DUF4188 domain-containing protein [Novosphingobium piscinae]
MSPPIRPGRFTAAHEGPLVVFVIGMRINRFRAVGKWLPVARAMPAMLRELLADPGSGFLGGQTMLASPRTIVMIQYWRDFDSLEGYARARDRRHWPAWTAFNQAVGGDGTVGIFHETYVVERGASETIYGNMPPFGLGRIAGLVPATGSREAARQRLRGDHDLTGD